MHSSTFEAVEYLPTAHAVHAVAPDKDPLFVIEPAAQSKHDATFEAVEYLPASHLSHLIAPAPVPVFVTDPAAHSEQYDLPPAD